MSTSKTLGTLDTKRRKVHCYYKSWGKLRFRISSTTLFGLVIEGNFHSDDQIVFHRMSNRCNLIG
jgi:hypothetical protein